MTHDRPRSQPDAQDAADGAEAHRAGGISRRRHQQDRLHDRAAEAVPAERGAARPQPCRRTDRLQPDPVARRKGRRGCRSRRVRTGGATRGGAGRTHGQGPGRVRAALAFRRPIAWSVDRSRGRHSRRRGHRSRRHPYHLDRHAPRHRRGPHRAARAAGRLRARRRQGHPRPPRHGGPAVRCRHERGDGGCDGCPQFDAGGRALPPQCRGRGGESLCRRPVRADRRRGRSRRRRGRNGRRIDHDSDLFRWPLRSFQRICARRAARDHGSCTRRRRMHCGCRANQDFIRDRADRRVRRARADVCSDCRRGTRRAADRLARHDREHRPASRRGDI